MSDIQIKLAFLWVAVMLTYLLGDVIRIFAGDTVPGEIEGMKLSQVHWLGIAALMVIPVVMIVLTVMLPQPVNRWSNIIMAGFFILFNLVGLPGYHSKFDPFLLVISMLFNGLTIWLAWGWV